MNEEYLTRIDEIKKEIDRTDTVVQFLEQKKKVQKNKTLMAQIQAYHELGNTPSLEKEQLKKRIYQNDDFRLYKHLENELFYFTLAVNRCLKKLTNKGKCER